MSPFIKTTTLITLFFFLAIGWHFGTVLGLFGTAPATQMAFFLRIIGIVVAVFVISIIAAVIFAKQDDAAPLPDEREEKIELLAERNGVFAIYAGLLCLIWFSLAPMTPMQIANGILLVVCFTELIKILSAFYFLRRGV